MKWNRNRIVGLTLIVSTLAALGFWEFWGRSNLGFDKVLVLKKDVPTHTRITAEMLTVKPIEHPGKGTLSAADRQNVEGLAAGQFIPAGEPLYAAYLTEPDFVADEGSGRYILALPETWIVAYPQTVRRGDRLFFYCGGEAVTDAVVAHVKDGNNQEVYSGGTERLNDSGSVQRIEVVVDAEQTSLLAKLADKGNRFLLLYQ